MKRVGLFPVLPRDGRADRRAADHRSGLRSRCVLRHRTSCLPGTDVNPATAPDYQSQYLAYAGLVWQDFLSLNFPAATDGSGRPLPEPSSTNGLNTGRGEYTAVWRDLVRATDLFQPGAALPPPFGGGHVLPNACAQLNEVHVQCCAASAIRLSPTFRCCRNTSRPTAWVPSWTSKAITCVMA